MINFEGNMQNYKICSDSTNKNVVILDVNHKIRLNPGDYHTVKTSQFSLELEKNGSASGTYQLIS